MTCVTLLLCVRGAKNNDVGATLEAVELRTGTAKWVPHCPTVIFSAPHARHTKYLKRCVLNRV